jgi:hypothetical protein
VIRDNLNDADGFPLEKILSGYRGTARDLTFDDVFVDRLLVTQKDDSNCYSILALLQPDVDIQQILHVDHLHPAAGFGKDRLATFDWLAADAELRSFYEDRDNWNSIANLWLLTESENTSKQDRPLRAWLEPRLGKTILDPLIPPDASLDFVDYRDFILQRRSFLKAKLVALVGSETVVAASAPLESADVD